VCLNRADVAQKQGAAMFLNHPRTGDAMAKKPTWYVSFEAPSQEKRFARLTQTFASEREAKQFAKAKLVSTQNITAGTINPHTPKLIVPPMQVFDWLEESDKADSLGRTVGRQNGDDQYGDKPK
jgi:hypothetical protein